jgi:hypothetical protein
MVVGKRAASPQLPSASNGKIFPTDADRTKVPGGYRPSRLATGSRMERSDDVVAAMQQHVARCGFPAILPWHAVIAVRCGNRQGMRRWEHQN